MSATEYLYYLSPAQRDRLRVSFEREQKTVIRFVVQYEAEIAGQWYAVVRYDSAHGFAHRDVIHLNGTVEKHPLPWMSYTVALTYATQELKTQWGRYRQAFEGEMRHDS